MFSVRSFMVSDDVFSGVCGLGLRPEIGLGLVVSDDVSSGVCGLWLGLGLGLGLGLELGLGIGLRLGLGLLMVSDDVSSGVCSVKSPVIVSNKAIMYTPSSLLLL